MRWRVTTHGDARPLVVLLKGAPAGVGVFATVLVLLVASAAIGARLPASGFLHRLPGLQQLDYSPDEFGRLPRLSRDFLLEALGGPALSRLVSDSVVKPRLVPRPSAAGPPPAESPSPPNEPEAGPLPGVFRGDWDLRPRMEADKETVEPNGTIEYALIVSNVGEERFQGDFVLTSHIPFGTTDATPSPCGDGGVDPDPEKPCAQPVAPVPGSPNPDVHQVTYSVGFTGDAGLDPGEEYRTSFRVRVNPSTSSGTKIANHAHLDVAGDGGGPIDTNVVVVTVE